MTIDTFTYIASILGAIVTTLIANVLWERHAKRNTALDLQYRIQQLESLDSTQRSRITDLEKQLTDLKAQEANRIAESERQQTHCRDEQKIAILKILDPNNGKRLSDIAKHVELSEKATIFHLTSLSDEGFVKSPNYSKTPEREPPFYNPSNSTWTIQQFGLSYLAQHDELA